MCFQPSAEVVYAFHWHDPVRSRLVISISLSTSIPAYYMLSVRSHRPGAPSLVGSCSKGDITDERFFRKTNDSDCTQFSQLYKAVPPHGALFSTFRGQRTGNSTSLRFLVWALFWITFQLAALGGFVLIGLASFKLTQDQMNAEAGKSFEAWLSSLVVDVTKCFSLQRASSQHSAWALFCPFNLLSALSV